MCTSKWETASQKTMHSLKSWKAADQSGKNHLFLFTEKKKGPKGLPISELPLHESFLPADKRGCDSNKEREFVPLQAQRLTRGLKLHALLSSRQQNISRKFPMEGPGLAVLRCKTTILSAIVP